MSQVTRFNGDYNITGIDPSGNVIVTANTFLVNGNLLVSGGASSITSTNTEITDNVITLNSGEAGAGVSLGTAGIDVDRGALTTASIYWNENPGFILSADGTSTAIPPRWEITDAAGNFQPIATSLTFSVVNDVAPVLGGDLDTHGKSIYNSAGDSVSFSTGLSISNDSQADVPKYKPGFTDVYSQVPGGGGSGLYVVNSASQHGEELITKSKAIVFALIM